jgi:hypothetical protein
LEGVTDVVAQGTEPAANPLHFITAGEFLSFDMVKHLAADKNYLTFKNLVVVPMSLVTPSTCEVSCAKP